MYPTPQPFFLLPRQTRMINASEGLRLQVLEGCLWLTRPGDATDRFLTAGSCIELHEDLVLIESDWSPTQTPVHAAHYRLLPLSEAAHATYRPRKALAGLLRWLPLRSVPV